MSLEAIDLSFNSLPLVVINLNEVIKLSVEGPLIDLLILSNILGEKFLSELGIES